MSCRACICWFDRESRCGFPLLIGTRSFLSWLAATSQWRSGGALQRFRLILHCGDLFWQMWISMTLVLLYLWRASVSIFRWHLYCLYLWRSLVSISFSAIIYFHGNLIAACVSPLVSYSFALDIVIIVSWLRLVWYVVACHVMTCFWILTWWFYWLTYELLYPCRAVLHESTRQSWNYVWLVLIMMWILLLHLCLLPRAVFIFVLISITLNSIEGIVMTAMACCHVRQKALIACCIMDLFITCITGGFLIGTLCIGKL